MCIVHSTLRDATTPYTERWALPFLSAKRTAKNSTVKPIEYLSKLKFNCLYSAPHLATIQSNFTPKY